VQNVVSPELALVDPDLRADALALLPRVEPFDFLRLRDLPSPAAARPFVAALAYVAVAVLRTCAFNAFVFASVVGLVLLLNRLA
jgi:hypothetical protein